MALVLSLLDHQHFSFQTVRLIRTQAYTYISEANINTFLSALNLKKNIFRNY